MSLAIARDERLMWATEHFVSEPGLHLSATLRRLRTALPYTPWHLE